MTEVHYQVWLAAKYISESSIPTANTPKQQPKPGKQFATHSLPQESSNIVPADDDADEMF